MGKLESFDQIDGKLEYLLKTWEWYMKHGGGMTRGYPSKSAGFVSAGYRSSEDFEEAEDIRIGEIMKAIIYDPKILSENEQSAIRHQYLDEKYCGLIVFYGATLIDAKRALHKAVYRKGIW